MYNSVFVALIGVLVFGYVLDRVLDALNLKHILSNPERKRRVFKFIHQKEVTKRAITYFVVHYTLHNKIAYWLDRRTYPYKIVGEYNRRNQPDILKLKEKGANIVWVNLHRDYRVSKNKDGRRNRHAPYRRSNSVKNEGGDEAYSLCELNFFTWLEDVGGFEAFYAFCDKRGE